MKSSILSSLLTAAALTSGLLAVASAPAQAYDPDCADFPSRAAQLFFLNNNPGADPHRLDADGDWAVCESLPGPHYYGRRDPTPGGTAPPPASQRKSKSRVVRQWARIIRVIDGDTVKAQLAAGGQRNVRLLGIDTPEVYRGVECGGREASASIKRILPVGTTVLLTSDPTQARTDRYKRLLRYVHKGKLDAGRRQIYNGHATVYVFQNKPFLRANLYRKVEADAKRAQRGLWGQCR